MNRFSNDDKVDMILMNGKSNKNAEQACNMYYDAYPARAQPNRTYFKKLESKLRKHGSLSVSKKRKSTTQDGAPPHNSQICVNYLNTIKPNYWIGTNGPIKWPPRSPDLTPLDFFLWAYVKDKVFISPPENVQDLKNKIRELKLPIQQGKSTVERKIGHVVNKYDTHNRRPGNSDFTSMFNVTDEKGEWLCREDREFYNLQVSTKGKVGYYITKEDAQGIHPRKMKSLKGKVSVTESFAEASREEISATEDSVSEEECFSSSEGCEKSSTRKRQKTDSAVRLVIVAKLSTRKVQRVCNTFSESGVFLPTSTQSGIYKAVMKEGEKLKIHLMENLKNEHWCLHFDGKI
ncbi:hypothetical protein CBL_05057 [Carabus blaptoides fortunei]